MEIHDLVGSKVGFCGVDNNAFCLVTPDGCRRAFEALEDECDGYRSMLANVESVPEGDRIFFRDPIAKLTVQTNEEVDGYELIDDSGHVWLTMGTSNADDYYPWFHFEYDPPR